MNQILKLLILSILFASCSSLKHDQRNLGKIHYRNPQLLEGYCAERFPVKIHDSVVEKYLPGKPIIIPGETVYMNCDSAIEAIKTAKTKGDTTKPINSKRVPCPPCPPSTKQVDTVDKYITKTVENTAMIALQSRRADEAEKRALLAEGKNQMYRKQVFRYEAFLAALIILGGLFIAIKSYFK